MPITLIATAAAIDANTYATLAEATAYHVSHLYGSTWNDADTDTQSAALVWATRLLDEQIEWNGQKWTITQALRWPRAGALDPDGYLLDSDTIPTFLKSATAELARYLIGEDRTAEPSRGFKEVTAGSVNVVFDPADRKPFLPPSVLSIVGPYGAPKGAGAGWAKLERV